ncbi:hypothetical protein LNAOJCKE_2281 [Methylorubrum aminovorans]|uniref:Uncharacterized protein n=1 Tax=Methylorubrum aminovorans TaxID=269069 RepID=A0ABQ4UDI5_9HYPH|nr:hypothetical protein [Methylorubrum aminovorans]GJE65073.1 hypothetical protein LNAOJCKE_2281 [Methylorubrum aminovorans]
MSHPPETPSFLAAVKRIEALTHEIRRDGLASFEKVEAAYTEVQELRAILNARISELRGRSA